MSKFTPAKKKPPQQLKPKWTPLPYMKKAMKFLIGQANAALFLDPGLRKTSITLASYKVLRKQGMTTGMLVVAPLRPARTVWPKEIAKWADFEDIDAVILRGPNSDRLVREQHDIYIINYERLDYLFARKNPVKKDGTVDVKRWTYYLTDAGKALLEHANILVWDELSKMKNSNTLRYALVKPHLHKFARKWGLTGSPAANGLLDLFGQCFVLDEGRTLGPYITYYKSQYFYAVDKAGYTLALLPGAEKAIQERVRPLALRMEAEDYIDLPKVISHVIKLDFPDDVRKKYDELESELITELRDETIVATNRAVSSGKCRQFCSGAIWLSDIDMLTGQKRKGVKREWLPVHTVKTTAFTDLVAELQGQQVLVAYEFTHELERLLEIFPDTPYIGGGVSEKRGEEIEAAWNKGDIPMLLGQPSSIGHGLNLQESNAHHIIHYTPTWDFEVYDQLNRRLLRSGNTSETLHIYHLVMRDSVEESVMVALRSKYKTQKQLLDAIKAKARVAD